MAEVADGGVEGYAGVDGVEDAGGGEGVESAGMEGRRGGRGGRGRYRPQACGDGEGGGDVVGAEEDGLAVLGSHAAQKGHNLETAGDVEEGCGFVEDDDVGVLGDGASYHGFLTLAVAEGGEE